MKKIFSVLYVVATLSACGDNTPVQTVDWYKEHDTERREMIAKCKNDMNTKDTNPNCVNAEQAQTAKEGARRGWIKPQVPTFE